MKGRTHAIIGANTVWLLIWFPSFSWNPLLLAVGALYALLPDMDASESKIKHLKIEFGKKRGRVTFKPFYLPALIFSRTMTHRGFLHSLLMTAIIIIINAYLAIWLGWEFAVVGSLGYLSHLAADSLTNHGISWLWPIKGHQHLLPKFLRFKTGSWVEDIFIIVGALLIVAYFYLSLNNFGFLL